MRRVIAYIDGFNLYYGMIHMKWRSKLWLNIQALAQNILADIYSQDPLRGPLGKGYHLEHSKYFTARVTTPPDKQLRQATFLDALGTLPGLSIIYGHYQAAPYKCKNCGATHTQYSEKMTDVNIAVELLRDAFADRFDVALLISGDGDLAPALQTIRDAHPQKRLIVAWPPRRHSAALASRAHQQYRITEPVVNKSALPLRVFLPSGAAVDCPTEWRAKKKHPWRP